MWEEFSVPWWTVGMLSATVAVFDGDLGLAVVRAGMSMTPTTCPSTPVELPTIWAAGKSNAVMLPLVRFRSWHGTTDDMARR